MSWFDPGIGPAEEGVDMRRRLGLIGASSIIASMLGAPSVSLGQGLQTLPGSQDSQAPAGAAAQTEFWSRPRQVWLRRPATGEEIRATWWADGKIIRHEYERVCWFLRDPRMERRINAVRASGKRVPATWYPAVEVSPVLLDILYATGGWLDWHGMARPLIMTSAFRHRVTNSATEGAARNSRHQHGGAADIVVPDVPASRVAAFGAWLRAGGVGFYPGKSFTHVDDGRLRTWRG